MCCGRLEHDFLRVVCGDCKHEKLVAFSCMKPGFCPSCGARRMEENAAKQLNVAWDTIKKKLESTLTLKPPKNEIQREIFT